MLRERHFLRNSSWFQNHNEPRKKRRRTRLKRQELTVLSKELVVVYENCGNQRKKRQCTPKIWGIRFQELVAMGQGISLVPQMAARADKSKRIVYRTLSGPKPSRTLAMIWHRHRYVSPLVKGLIDVVRREGKRICIAN